MGHLGTVGRSQLASSGTGTPACRQGVAGDLAVATCDKALAHEVGDDEDVSSRDYLGLGHGDHTEACVQ
jgi:hypothetical protein